ncbi:MAG: thioredoxin family protein [Nitrospirae bacterium]|nr:thioredoxin family protein [Nitrospirota bacterium]MCL5977802.1 thioredoxin family protein [Nitrospirota bacterium]
MKKHYALMIIAVLFIYADVFAASEIKWLTLKEGTEKAKIEKKPMIVDFFYGKGCPRCDLLQRIAYDNPAIAKKLMNDFIPVRVDLTRTLTKEEERLGNQYDFKDECLLLFLDHNGNIIKDPVGKKFCLIDAKEPQWLSHLEAEWFAKYLDAVLSNYKK